MGRHAPYRVELTRHALDRCADAQLDPQMVGEAILTYHHRRRRNPAQADWKLAVEGMIMVYNWPHHGDSTTARVVTVWRQR